MLKPVVETFTRYFLAIIMIVYGWVKITGVQFLSHDELPDISLKEVDGTTILFSFLGFSRWLLC